MLLVKMSHSQIDHLRAEYYNRKQQFCGSVGSSHCSRSVNSFRRRINWKPQQKVADQYQNQINDKIKRPHHLIEVVALKMHHM